MELFSERGKEGLCNRIAIWYYELKISSANTVFMIFWAIDLK